VVTDLHLVQNAGDPCHALDRHCEAEDRPCVSSSFFSYGLYCHTEHSTIETNVHTHELEKGCKDDSREVSCGQGRRQMVNVDRAFEKVVVFVRLYLLRAYLWA
jgi:hypothetical protein